MYLTAEAIPVAPPLNFAATNIIVNPAVYNKSVLLSWLPPTRYTINGVLLGYYLSVTLTDTLDNIARGLYPTPMYFTFTGPGYTAYDLSPNFTVVLLQPYISYDFVLVPFNSQGPPSLASSLTLSIAATFTLQTPTFTPTLAPLFSLSALSLSSIFVAITTLPRQQQNGIIQYYNVQYGRSVSNIFSNYTTTTTITVTVQPLVLNVTLTTDFANIALEAFVEYTVTGL